jgi:four helix bundle protein
MAAIRKNMNRGYMKLNVWQDSKELFILSQSILKKFPFEMRKPVQNQLAAVDSIHRNIAEGYCRKSINEYLHFLNISLASLAEAVSSVHVYRAAGLFNEEEFDDWDKLAYKIENGLIKLIKSLQIKRKKGNWEDSFIIEESNFEYAKSIIPDDK